MKYIGNKIWHEATANSEKMICHISKKQFESMQRILDSASLNYYVYEKENICRVAVNKSDITMIWNLLDNNIDFKPTSFSYSPASMNIFGTVAYKEIHPKRYLNGEHDVMLKIADALMKQGIPFSGRSYDSQTTITVSQEYLDAASAIARQIRIQRDSNHIPVSAEPIETIAEELTSSPMEKKSDEDDLQHELPVNESIQSAFSAVKQEFTLSEKQLQFLERLERFAVSNNITENLLDSAFEKSHAFRAAYGSPKQLSKNVFAGRMQRIMKALEERLTESTVPEAETEHTADSYDKEKQENKQESSSDIQLSLFPDEPESQVQSQSNSDSSPLFVGDVNIYDALHNELMRGSGFTEGKFRIQEFYRSNKPSVSEFARMLKNEYGIGGHSVNDDSGLWLVNHDGKGLEFCVHTDTEDEAFRFSWNDAAKYLSELIEKNEYITQEDIERREKRTAQETKQPDSLTFSFSRDDEGWFTESELLYDFAQNNPDISFALGNAIIAYLDEKQHTERNNPDNKAGWYKKTSFEIHSVIDGEEYNYDGRYDIGDGDGSLTEHIANFNQWIVEKNPFKATAEELAAHQRNLDVFVPFLKEHSTLTPEEEKLLEDFKAAHPIIENTIVKDFKAKTEEHFHEIGGYTPEDIENTVKDWVSEKLADNNIDAEIKNVIVAGSRSRGLEHDNSDIDVVVELRSELPEDALFNILHEDYIDIDGIPIDINPIRPEETGTLETYLPAAEKYLEEKRTTPAELNKSYRIYQLKDGEEYHGMRFTIMRGLKRTDLRLIILIMIWYIRAIS